MQPNVGPLTGTSGLATNANLWHVGLWSSCPSPGPIILKRPGPIPLASDNTVLCPPELDHDESGIEPWAYLRNIFCLLPAGGSAASWTVVLGLPVEHPPTQ